MPNNQRQHRTLHIQKDVLHIQKDVLHIQKDVLPYASTRGSLSLGIQPRVG